MLPYFFNPRFGEPVVIDKHADGLSSAIVVQVTEFAKWQMRSIILIKVTGARRKKIEQ